MLLPQRRLVLVLFILLRLFSIGNARKSPAKVFLIAGDDNVEGFGYLSQLDAKLSDPQFQQTAEAEKYAHLQTSSSDSHQWATRNDVFVVFERERHKQLQGTLNMIDYGGLVNETFG